MGKNVPDQRDSTVHSHRGKRGHGQSHFKWMEQKAGGVQLQGGGKGEHWQEITSDQSLTNLVTQELRSLGFF